MKIKNAFDDVETSEVGRIMQMRNEYGWRLIVANVSANGTKHFLFWEKEE
jgi:hypothetical protein